MSGPVTYRRDESIATITMDDGKVNALGPPMLQALNEALDNADRDDVGAVVIAGNHRVFSGGFDLKVFQAGELQPAIDMLRGGFELSYRLLSYPKPVVMACTGPAIAMGSFLLCSGDHRIAAPDTTFRPMRLPSGWSCRMRPWRSCKLRLTRSAYQQAVGLSKVFFGETALAAGFIDEIDLTGAGAQSGPGSCPRIHQARSTRTRGQQAACPRPPLKELRAGIDGVPAEVGAQ